MFALNLDSTTKRILSATSEEFAQEGMPLVESLPSGNISNYLYIDNQYISDPLPEPDPYPVEKEDAKNDIANKMYDLDFHKPVVSDVNTCQKVSRTNTLVTENTAGTGVDPNGLWDVFNQMITQRFTTVMVDRLKYLTEQVTDPTSNKDSNLIVSGIWDYLFSLPNYEVSVDAAITELTDLVVNPTAKGTVNSKYRHICEAYARRILRGEITLDDVPERFREEVRQILEEENKDKDKKKTVKKKRTTRRKKK